jgi:GDPmannose 4,6-dehydratase
MHRMLQLDTPEDFVIATGETRKLEDFVSAAFKRLGLNWKEYTRTDERLLRPTEIMIGRGNSSKAEKKLGWKAKYRMEDVVRMMAEAHTNNAEIERERARSPGTESN